EPRGPQMTAWLWRKRTPSSNSDSLRSRPQRPWRSCTGCEAPKALDTRWRILVWPNRPSSLATAFSLPDLGGDGGLAPSTALCRRAPAAAFCGACWPDGRRNQPDKRCSQFLRCVTAEFSKVRLLGDEPRVGRNAVAVHRQYAVLS